jgi:hypothetical protein
MDAFKLNEMAHGYMNSQDDGIGMYVYLNHKAHFMDTNGRMACIKIKKGADCCIVL